MKYAVIDVSSSSITMTVLDGDTDETLGRSRETFSVRHYMEGNCLSRRGIERLTDCVGSMKRAAKNLDADILYLISTAAMRRMANGGEVSDAVLQHTGLSVNFIDAGREVYCDYAANTRYAGEPGGALLLDVGGASTEICNLSESGTSGLYSLDFGFINLHTKFVDKVQPDMEEGDKIKKYLKKKFEKAKIPGEGDCRTLVLAGSTSLALYDLYIRFTKGQPGTEKEMDYRKFRKMTDYLLDGAGRSSLLLEAAPDKMYSAAIVAVYACAVYKRLSAERLIVSDRGVKEGYLYLVRKGIFRAVGYDLKK